MTVVLVDARYYGDIMRQTGGVVIATGNAPMPTAPVYGGGGGVVLCTTGGGEITSYE